MDSSILQFGKYRGSNICDVWERDQQYCKWLYTQELLTGNYPAIKEYLINKFKGADLPYVMTWGKYKKMSINWIETHDSQYIDWLLSNHYVETSCTKLFTELQSLRSQRVPAPF